MTNETGSYVLPNLPMGPYDRSVIAGISNVRSNRNRAAGQRQPCRKSCPGSRQVTEQVEVQANAALVETRSAGVGQVVENARILELPLNGRQIVELIALAGGATPPRLVTGSGRDPFAKASFSVAGGLNTGTELHAGWSLS